MFAATVGRANFRESALTRHASAAALLCLLLVPSTSSAADCAGPQVEMTQCASDRAEASRKSMEAAYRALAGRVEPGTRVRLEAAQKAWNGYLEATCELIAKGGGGGSIAPMYHANCLEEMRNERARYLRKSMGCSDTAPHCIEAFVD
jgi:uncharacterized protein YecT (DUF1311 family)